ncbi:fibropellin-1-like [Mya arenaria]|uniref:fibropellin-1-like n=1 Tax=Mya arenaria TaxID=6604 RepID=UPI0022E71CAD|nr:fibropellin-1-like [Mya arenaria]
MGSYTCTCKAGFSGTHCENDVNECYASPCQNGGTCENVIGTYRCLCKAGFTGEHCENDVDECSSTPCQNVDTCVNSMGSYTCTCKAGFSGTHCENDVNECYASPCQNGGTCENVIGTYRCLCKAGFTGEHCENAKRPTYIDSLITIQTCSLAHNTSGHCAECCGTDFCNDHGCGDPGLTGLPRDQRGPICFDCNHALTIDECTSVRPCLKHEVCAVEKFNWFGHFNFKLGCVDATCGPLDKRSVPVCKSCCDQDFCNRNCSDPHSPVIVG